MTHRIVGSVLILCAYLILPKPAAAQTPPLPANAIYKPTFLFLDESFCAGTAFVLSSPGGKLLLLVPDHLFGPDGGLNAPMTPSDISSQICGVAGLSMEDKTSICTAGKYAKIEEAAPLESGDAAKDLAVFSVDHAPGGSFKLANTDPKVGDKVWMYARLRGTDKVALFPATVSYLDEKQLQYTFDGHPDPLNGTSGAPILNAKGEIVGMNLGGGATKDKSGVFGIANPVWSLRKEIAAYVK